MRLGAKVRSTNDGQLGTLVESETGDLMVRLDRPAERLEVPFNATRWMQAPDERLSPMQLARVAYAADQALRLVRGSYGIPDWVALKEAQRLPWLKGLPADADDLRRKLHRAIADVLAGEAVG